MGPKLGCSTLSGTYLRSFNRRQIRGSTWVENDVFTLIGRAGLLGCWGGFVLKGGPIAHGSPQTSHPSCSPETHTAWV